MFNRFDKETSENIERVMNGLMGMSHRSKPYDLNHPEDMRELFLLSIAACADYRRYWSALSDIDEDMDESLEYYDTATWMNMTIAPEKTDDLAMEATASLSGTVDLFSQLRERAEQRCSDVIGMLLAAPPDIQRAVFGRTYAIPEEERGARIEELFEEWLDVEVHDDMEENRDEFLALMRDAWKDE